jgi:hypothetical protein
VSASTVHVRLHLEEPALNEDERLLGLVRHLDPHRAGLDLGEERRVLRVDAELADDARQHHELRLAGVDRLLGGNDIDMDGVGHGAG